MTTRRKNFILASCTAAGLLLTAGVAKAIEADVSTIYGRASPPHMSVEVWSGAVEARAAYSPNGTDADVVTTATATDADTLNATAAAAKTNDFAAADEVTTPTGQYLDVDPATRPDVFAAGTPVNRDEDQALDGTPLVAGRGMREGVEFHPEPVYSDPPFSVDQTLGRASPPSPADVTDFYGVGG